MDYKLKGLFWLALLESCTGQFSSIFEPSSSSAAPAARQGEPGYLSLVIREGEVFNLPLKPEQFLWNFTEDTGSRAEYRYRY